jgi:hypothetical protein
MANLQPAPRKRMTITSYLSPSRAGVIPLEQLAGSALSLWLGTGKAVASQLRAADSPTSGS